MPAFRNVRRSRRLSRQPPRNSDNDEFDIYDHELMYPGDDGPPSPPISPDVELPSPDEAGEPEVEAQVEPDSPPMSPAKVTFVVTERTSHSRKKKPGHIKRPPNAFMIYRSELCRKRKINITVEKDHRQISRIAGELWNELCAAEREPYHALAEEAKLQHAAKYPDYKYSPVYRRDKPANRKAKQSQPDKVNRCHKVVRLLQQGFEGEALTRELERLDAASRDRDQYSDASDYDARPRKKAARQRARKASACARRRKTRRTQAKDDDEYVPTEHERTPTRDSSVKAGRPTPLFSQPGSCPADAPDAFVPTSEIPPLDLGEPCMNEEAEKITFTNPFAPVERAAPTNFNEAHLYVDFLGSSLGAVSPLDPRAPPPRAPISSSSLVTPPQVHAGSPLSPESLMPPAALHSSVGIMPPEASLSVASPRGSDFFFSELDPLNIDAGVGGQHDLAMLNPRYFDDGYIPGTLPPENLDFSEWMQYPEEGQ